MDTAYSTVENSIDGPYGVSIVYCVLRACLNNHVLNTSAAVTIQVVNNGGLRYKCGNSALSCKNLKILPIFWCWFKSAYALKMVLIWLVHTRHTIGVHYYAPFFIVFHLFSFHFHAIEIVSSFAFEAWLHFVYDGAHSDSIRQLKTPPLYNCTLRCVILFLLLAFSFSLKIIFAMHTLYALQDNVLFKCTAQVDCWMGGIALYGMAWHGMAMVLYGYAYLV